MFHQQVLCFLKCPLQQLHGPLQNSLAARGDGPHAAAQCMASPSPAAGLLLRLLTGRRGAGAIAGVQPPSPTSGSWGHSRRALRGSSWLL